MAQKPVKKNEGLFEENLWDAANKLRGSVESSEYKHVVLSLIFLKFVSDKFEKRKIEIGEEYGENFIDEVSFYGMENTY